MKRGTRCAFAGRWTVAGSFRFKCRDVRNGRESATMSRATAEHSQTFTFSVMNCIPDGVMLRGADGTLLDANEAFCRMTGFERGELVGLTPPFPYWPDEHVA